MELTDAQIGYFVDNRLKLPQGEASRISHQVDYLIERFKAKVDEESAFGIKKFLKTGSLRKGTVLRPRDGCGELSVGRHRSSMATIASTQDEWTIHALNIHGVFFERRCANAVAATAGWKVLATNYPVEYPPPNGPWRGKESSLDIWARRDIDPNFVVDTLIECKKANPDFVNWVFFLKPESPTPTPFNFAKAINTPNPSGSGPWTSQVILQRRTTGLSIANDAREVRGDYLKHQSGNKTKTSNAAIQEAAYQVALANRAIVQEDTSLLATACSSTEHPAPPWPSKAYVPIIVTTAQLFRADVAPNSTDLGSGEIGLTDATLTPVQSILYEYALPKHLQFAPAKPLDILKTGNTEAFSRMHILVVHSEALPSFLCDLFAGSP